MGLAIYDDQQVVLSSGTPKRSQVNGRAGESDIFLTYLRNDDATVYYTSLTYGFASTGAYGTDGELAGTGWSFKAIYGQRRPTELEWDKVNSGEAVSIPDIGDTTAADMSTYHPIWVRIFVPGGTAAQRRDYYKFVVQGLVRKVGT